MVGCLSCSYSISGHFCWRWGPEGIHWCWRSAQSGLIFLIFRVSWCFSDHVLKVDMIGSVFRFTSSVSLFIFNSMTSACTVHSRDPLTFPSCQFISFKKLTLCPWEFYSQSVIWPFYLPFIFSAGLNFLPFLWSFCCITLSFYHTYHGILFHINFCYSWRESLPLTKILLKHRCSHPLIFLFLIRGRLSWIGKRSFLARSLTYFCSFATLLEQSSFSIVRSILLIFEFIDCCRCSVLQWLGFDPWSRPCIFLQFPFFPCKHSTSFPCKWPYLYQFQLSEPSLSVLKFYELSSRHHFDVRFLQVLLSPF